ncbi:Haloacid dehalogenase-like hydrolase-domain-containing protein [Fimicolochytrium jonesii]|uniref:Haloacid dehalogenase-like hydrolase-domain-containing protein n=1 Tax=Fimicolochytrium jonesii TaxID=1396493 RepID=UPI0022FDE7F1|nr:Haloacid dehalogenase-like hydrolase-domain-containing protein [Fimicolochytrium jonesii]KAI8819855.1 Haloacid dehalogenase-like hydrolase-domain-containing protein [Fimicolochytrium jonesii]
MDVLQMCRPFHIPMSVPYLLRHARKHAFNGGRSACIAGLAHTASNSELHSLQHARKRQGQRRDKAHFRMAAANSTGETSGKVFFFDIDNCLYPKSTGIYREMGRKIHAYFKRLGFPDEEATELHHRYYRTYGLALRGLVKHHDVDPMAYDREVDQALPLEQFLKPDPELRTMLETMQGVKKWAFTNAYEVHAGRVLKALGIEDQFAGLTFCDYATPNFPCKPEEVYYEQVMQAAGVTDPSKCYLVDDAAANIDMAKKLGWTAVHVADDVSAEPKHGDFQISHIHELQEVLPEFWPDGNVN